MACKKKLYAFRPDVEFVETYRTNRRDRQEPCDPVSLERGVRQLLANKVSGNLVGLWLLIPEHLRLGTWDLLCGWTGKASNTVQPRLALQLVNEAALCVTGDPPISQSQPERLRTRQWSLLRRQRLCHPRSARAPIPSLKPKPCRWLWAAYAGPVVIMSGKLLAIDPHHMRSYTKRQTRRHRHKENEAAVKTLQTFFCLDADSKEPLAFTTGTAARTATQATPGLLSLAEAILMPEKGEITVMADKEHCTVELFNHAARHTSFDLLVPQPSSQALLRQLKSIPR